jgi:hypothetical protein
MNKILSFGFALIFGALTLIMFCCAIAQFRWDHAIYCIFTFIITVLLIKEIREE